MRIFTRFKDIISANINHLLDRAEDPEKMIRLMAREMEGTIVDLKQNCTEQLAMQMRNQREIAELKEQSERWQGRARLAVKGGKDDLAEEALLHYNRCQARLEDLERDSVELERGVSELQEQIAKLQEKLSEVKNKRLLLVQRSKTASQIQRSNEVLQRSAEEAGGKFAELEDRVEIWEARATTASFARSTAEQEFSELERHSKLQQQLEQLKQELKLPVGQTDREVLQNEKYEKYEQ